MNLHLNPSSPEDYQTFLKVKSLPRYSFVGRTAIVPDEYAKMLGIKQRKARGVAYDPLPSLFDYQRDISELSIRKRKFAVFARCGIGKSLIFLEFAKTAAREMPDKCILIISPLMVIKQTIAEAYRFYGESLPIKQLRAHELNAWLANGKGIGITNFEAMTEEIQPGRVGAIIIDEASMLKSHYGKWGQQIIRLGKGLDWKLSLTGTPAPNDRIEYANQAVFLDRYPTINSFLARFFVNRGETQNRWELKPHALEPFYRSLSDWCIFLTNPGTYGWKDNCHTIPPIHVHIEDVMLTNHQRNMVMDNTGMLFAGQSVGGIVSRIKMSRIAKGHDGKNQIETLKPAYIRDRIASWPDESTLVWCIYNDEQERMTAAIPGAQSIDGNTEEDERERIVEDFKSKRLHTLVSKSKCLGFGLNLQVCTRMVFSGLMDSYEMFHQCVSRANRIGAEKDLNVHIPITEVERPMVETVLKKAKRVDEETEEQERIFKQNAKGILP
jgi:superfamily II DNA or RNA helicase